MEAQTIQHPIPAVFDEHSRVLILGSFPSVKSRETAFFYGHPQNRFWPLLAALYGEEKPDSIDEKRSFLLRHRIALWDVLARCTIQGSADSSIRDAVPNDFDTILRHAPIRAVFANGQTAGKLYERHRGDAPPTVTLPSTSPANGRFSMDDLRSAWAVILPYTERE